MQFLLMLFVFLRQSERLLALGSRLPLHLLYSFLLLVNNASESLAVGGNPLDLRLLLLGILPLFEHLLLFMVHVLHQPLLLLRSLLELLLVVALLVCQLRL